jgi:hypothetical protein
MSVGVGHTRRRIHPKILAEHLDCPTVTSGELLQCLRTRSAEDIVGIRRNITLPELVLIGMISLLV